MPPAAVSDMKAIAFAVASLFALGAFADYRVFANGKEVALIEAPKPTKYWKGQMYDQYAQPYWAAIVDARGETEFRVESDVHDLSAARFLPPPAGLSVTSRDARQITFRATPPFKFSLEANSRYRTLAFVVREPCRPPVDQKGAKVKYFAAGRHRREKPIRLSSNDILYLETGAVVEAAVYASGTNIAICGHGVLSGVPWEWRKGPQRQFVHFKEAKDVRVEGVSLLGPYHWSLVLENVERARVDDIAVLGGRVINDDGIDICRSRQVYVGNSFFKVQDDNIAVKWWGEDVLVENCIFWADVARIVHIGGECDAPPRAMRRIKVRNVDVLHQSICKPVRGEPVLHINASNGITIGNIEVEGVRMWAPEWRDLFARIETLIVREAKGWAWYDRAGYVNDVRVSDVKYLAKLPREAGGIKAFGYDAGYTVSNVVFEALNFKPDCETNAHAFVRMPRP
jgi:hypothetical protein